MKKLLYLIAGLTLPSLASAQLQNLDFENWENPIPSEELHNKPTGWDWTNTELIQPATPFYYPPSEHAQSNNYALKLSVWYNYQKDAAVQSAPINYKPTALKGFYKYEHNFIYGSFAGLQKDTALVSVYLTKHNSTTNSNDTVGMGLLSIGDSVGTYKPFTVNIVYSQPEMPDGITVILDPSLCRRSTTRSYQIQNDTLGGRTSFFTVDNLALIGNNTAGIEDIQSKSRLHIFPNPVQDILHFENASGELTVFDLAGKQVLQIESESITAVNVSGLNKGMYLLKINNGGQISQSRFEKW